MKSGSFSKPKLSKLQLLSFRSKTALGHLQTWQETLNCQAYNRRDLHLGTRAVIPAFPTRGFYPKHPLAANTPGFSPSPELSSCTAGSRSARTA